MEPTSWTKLLCRETLERLTMNRHHIEHGLKAMGHELDAVIKVEQALEWLLRQPTKSEG